MLDLSKFNVPPGARWVAADGTGTVYAYEDAPHRIDIAEMWTADGGLCRRIGKVKPTSINWRESLTPVTTIDTILDALLALDGAQECDLVAAFVRADPRRADAFLVTLAEALEPAQSASAPETSLRIIAEIVESLLILTPAERGTVAKELAEADAAQADEFAVMLTRQATAVRLKRMLRGIFDVDDYEAQIAGAQ